MTDPPHFELKSQYLSKSLSHLHSEPPYYNIKLSLFKEINNVNLGVCWKFRKLRKIQKVDETTEGFLTVESSENWRKLKNHMKTSGKYNLFS